MGNPRPTYTEARDEACNNVHGNVHAAGLQSAPDDRKDCADKQRPPSPNCIRRLGTTQGAEETTGLEKTIDRAGQLGSI